MFWQDFDAKNNQKLGQNKKKNKQKTTSLVAKLVLRAILKKGFNLSGLYCLSIDLRGHEQIM